MPHGADGATAAPRNPPARRGSPVPASPGRTRAFHGKRRASSWGYFQVSGGDGRWGQAADPDGTMSVVVRAWGDDSGTAALAIAGDMGAPWNQGYQDRRVIPPQVPNHRRGLLCMPSAMCGMGWLGSSCQCLWQDRAGTCLLLTPLFSFPRSPPGQRWGQAAPQPLATPTSPLASPLRPWRTPGSPQHSTDLPEGKPGMGHVPAALPQPQHSPASPHRDGA